ncbi:MAG: hypothetical protein E7374_01955 [Clostridiales bacterium]|nr:hypothetical protein [Clostridiales bacterium]
MTFVKDKSSIKYFCLAGIILLCLYSSAVSELFVPIFDDIYYGNLVKLFTSLINAIVWGVEIILILFVCKKLKIELFENKNKKELTTIQVILLFVLAILPMLIVSACINWKVKIVYSLGVKVTSVGLACNAVEILSFAVRMVLMILFIVCTQKGCEKIFKTKWIIPYGAIFALLTFGIIDFFVLAMDLRAFYLIISFLYGIIYLVAEKKFGLTWLLCYLVYLL